MPHFYFHLRSPAGLTRDKFGQDFDDLEAAYLEACLTIPDMGADLVKRRRNPLPYTFEIANEAGQLLMDVPFSEMLDKGHKSRPRRRVMPALVRKAHVEMERTARLIASLAEEREALQTSLREARELVARARQVSDRSHWQRQV